MMAEIKKRLEHRLMICGIATVCGFLLFNHFKQDFIFINNLFWFLLIIVFISGFMAGNMALITELIVKKEVS